MKSRNASNTERCEITALVRTASTSEPRGETNEPIQKNGTLNVLSAAELQPFGYRVDEAYWKLRLRDPVHRRSFVGNLFFRLF